MKDEIKVTIYVAITLLFVAFSIYREDKIEKKKLKAETEIQADTSKQ